VASFAGMWGDEKVSKGGRKRISWKEEPTKGRRNLLIIAGHLARPGRGIKINGEERKGLVIGEGKEGKTRDRREESSHLRVQRMEERLDAGTAWGWAYEPLKEVREACGKRQNRPAGSESVRAAKV